MSSWSARQLEQQHKNREELELLRAAGPSPLDNIGTMAWAGIVCGLASLLFWPPLLGCIGIGLGAWAIHEGDKKGGPIAVGVSLLSMIVGTLIGASVGSRMFWGV